MIFSKYHKYKQGGCWLGYHYIDHRSNHVHNAELRKKYRSKRLRRWMRDAWNHNNRVLDVYLVCRMAFVDRNTTGKHNVRILTDFATKFIAQQKPLPADDMRILEENLWSLV